MPDQPASSARERRDLADCRAFRDEVVEVNGKCPACLNPISWHPTKAVRDARK